MYCSRCVVVCRLKHVAKVCIFRLRCIVCTYLLYFVCIFRLRFYKFLVKTGVVGRCAAVGTCCRPSSGRRGRSGSRAVVLNVGRCSGSRGRAAVPSFPSGVVGIVWHKCKGTTARRTQARWAARRGVFFTNDKKKKEIENDCTIFKPQNNIKQTANFPNRNVCGCFVY